MAPVALSSTGAVQEGSEHPGGHPSQGFSRQHNAHSQLTRRVSENPQPPSPQRAPQNPGLPCVPTMPLTAGHCGSAAQIEGQTETLWFRLSSPLQRKFPGPMVTDKNFKKPQGASATPEAGRHTQGTEQLLFQVHQASLKWLLGFSGSRLQGFFHAGRQHMHCSHPDSFKSIARSQGYAPGGAAPMPAGPAPVTWNQLAAALAQVWGQRGHSENPWGFPASLRQALASAGRHVSVPTPAILPTVQKD